MHGAARSSTSMHAVGPGLKKSRNSFGNEALSLTQQSFALLRLIGTAISRDLFQEATHMA